MAAWFDDERRSEVPPVVQVVKNKPICHGVGRLTVTGRTISQRRYESRILKLHTVYRIADVELTQRCSDSCGSAILRVNDFPDC